MQIAWIKKLSPQAEFLIVILTAFGLPTATSLFLMVYHMKDKAFAWSPGMAAALLLEELFTFGLIALLLRSRGWKREQFNAAITWRLCAGGLVLTIATYLLFAALFLLLMPVWPWIKDSTIQVNTGGIGLLSIVLMSVVNPVFEEVLAVGYVVSAIRREQPAWVAILVSALIRSIYHSYQGPFAVLAVLCMGILFAYTYHRWNSLWPLIVSHALLDVIGLLAHR